VLVHAYGIRTHSPSNGRVQCTLWRCTTVLSQPQVQKKLHCPTLTQPQSVVNLAHVSCLLHHGVQQLETARG